VDSVVGSDPGTIIHTNIHTYICGKGENQFLNRRIKLMVNIDRRNY
jgi:hypothetical protein